MRITDRAYPFILDVDNSNLARSAELPKVGEVVFTYAICLEHNIEELLDLNAF